MTQSLVSSIIAGARYRMGLTAPTTVYGSGDPDVTQSLHIFYAVCEELLAARCWPQLKRKYSFSTSAARTKYYLPTDYHSPVIGTYWNETQDERLYGPVSDGDFTYLLESGASSTTDYTYRIFGRDENSAGVGGQFEINPAPSTAETLSFEYMSRNYLMPPNWAASTAYTVTPTLSYVNANGNIYVCTQAGTSSATTAPTATSGTIVDGTANWNYYSSTYNRITSDNDVCLFEPELVRLGFRSKWMEEKGGQYQDAKAEYKAAITAAVSRWRGSYRGSMGKRRMLKRYESQYKGWTF